MRSLTSIAPYVCAVLALSSTSLADPNDGPQYYTDSVVVSGGSSYTARVPAASTPIYVSSTESASTQTFLSTSATTIYQTFTSLATYESASTTTSYPTCSGTITVTTSIMIPYDVFKVVGTSFISAQVFESVYISGTVTSEFFSTSTTTYYKPGPPDVQTTTAPTDIHTAPFALTFPCATTTVTRTLSYEPAIVTEVQIRETYATTFSSSESYYTVSGTSYSTATYVSTVLVPYPASTATSSVVSGSSTVVEAVVYYQTATSYNTFYSTYAAASTETFHITASEGGTVTTELGAVATGGTTGASTFVTSVAVSNSTTPTPIASVPSQTTVLPSATGAAVKLGVSGAGLFTVLLAALML